MCLRVIKGKTFEYPIYFDLEEQSPFAKGRTFCSEIVKAFCSTLEKAGYYTGLYISRSPLQKYITPEVAKRYTLWIAEYNSKCNYNGNYDIWQYTGSGKIQGISGRVDLDYSYKDFAKIIPARGFNGFTKTKQALKTGDKILLKNTPIYATADSKRLNSWQQKERLQQKLQ